MTAARYALTIHGTHPRPVIYAQLIEALANLGITVTYAKAIEAEPLPGYPAIESPSIGENLDVRG